MTADGQPRCLWRIRDCALLCLRLPVCGRRFALLRNCEGFAGITAELFFFFCGAAVRAALLPVLPDG